MDTSDGVLSVLPLHHTFEFSTGFLTPLSRGAQITYLPELTGDHLAKAIKNGHVTGMVGVPALWELLHRRIKNRLSDNGRVGFGNCRPADQIQCLAARQDAAELWAMFSSIQFMKGWAAGYVISSAAVRP